MKVYDDIYTLRILAFGSNFLHHGKSVSIGEEGGTAEVEGERKRRDCSSVSVKQEREELRVAEDVVR